MTRTGGADATFPRRLRILLGRDFERVMRSGRNSSSKTLRRLIRLVADVDVHVVAANDA